MKHNYAIIALIMLCYTFSFANNAQQLDSEQIKTAYLYNFFKHIRWHNEQQKNTFTLGVYQDETYFNKLFLLLNERKVKNKNIRVIHVASSQQARTTDLLFISSRHNLDIPALAAEIRSSNTLLVTDNSNDKHDVMVNLLYDKSTETITFEINKSNIIFEKLMISKDLLLLGGTELDVALLYRETEVAMQAIKQRELELALKLTNQEQQLNETSLKIKKLNNVLITREKKVEQGQKQLTMLKQDVAFQKSALISKEQKYSSTVAQLTKAQKALLNHQQSLIKKEQQYQLMIERIDSNKKILQICRLINRK